MPVITKASSSTTVVVKRSAPVRTIETRRSIAAFEDLNDIEISSPQDGQILVYDSTSDKFTLVDPDVVLSQSVEDNDLPDDFIDQLESELDLGDIVIDTLDGGGFV